METFHFDLAPKSLLTLGDSDKMLWGLEKYCEVLPTE